MILTCAEMKALEERAFADGISAGLLMEQAGALIARAVRQFFPKPGVCLAVFGRGNNGGDALVAARHLAWAGWDTRLVAAFPEEQWGALTREKFREAIGRKREGAAALAGARGTPMVVLDGLLGIGARGPLREPLTALTHAINGLRATSGAHVFALDLPTGLNGDTGAADEACVVADTTLAIGFAKRGLIADGAANFIGRLCVLPLAELSARADAAQAGEVVATPEVLAPLLARRKFDTHKGDYGRIGILAGSQEMPGAAALCATACVHAGAGLVTLYSDAAKQLAGMMPPEVMVRPFADGLAGENHDVLAIGPGLGATRADEILALIASFPNPIVADADALNALAANPEVLSRAAGPRVLTPHPGEMARLDPGSATRSRRETVREFTRRFPGVTLLLKGARTLTGRSGEPLSYNTTGSPGMATGGMGDTLTGVIAALIAQAVRTHDAARLGAWLCGRAAERAIFDGGQTEETLTPSAVIEHLAGAFRDLRARGF